MTTSVLRFFALPLGVLTLGLYTAGAEADIYRWVDAKGTLCFGTDPPRSGESRALHRLETSGALPAAESAAPAMGETAPGEGALTEEAVQEPIADEEGGTRLSLAVSDLPRVYLSEAELRQVTRRPVAARPQFQAAARARFRPQGAYLSEAMLGRAELTAADLRRASLAGAYLGGAKLAR